MMASNDTPCTGAYYGDLEVEVKAGNGSYFKAYVVDIFENEVVVAFENEWQPRSKVPLADVRLPDHQTSSVLKVGDQAEVFSRSKKTEPCGYWSCKIVQQKGEFLVIEYTGLDANFVNEIVEHDRLRPPNRNPPIASKSFYKCIIELPDSLRDVCEDMSLHRDLLKACNARMIVGDRYGGTLTMLSQSEDLIYRAEMLADIHVRSLPTKVLLKQRAAEKHTGAPESQQRPMSTTSLDYASTEEAPLYPFSDEFTVADDLLGLAIGARGANLTAAKAIRGVAGVELNDSNNTFYVGAETKEAVEQARHLLEYLKVTTYIPQAFTGRMIGKGGAKMQEIVEQSGVVRGSTELVNESFDVPFVFVGRRKSVDHARLLLDYHFLLMKELDDLSTVRARDAPTQSFRRSWFPVRIDPDRGSSGARQGGRSNNQPRPRRTSNEQPDSANSGNRRSSNSSGGAGGRGGGRGYQSRGGGTPRQGRQDGRLPALAHSDGRSYQADSRESDDYHQGPKSSQYSQVSVESASETEFPKSAGTHGGRGRRNQRQLASAPTSAEFETIPENRAHQSDGRNYRAPLQSATSRYTSYVSNPTSRGSLPSVQSSLGTAPSSMASKPVSMTSDQEQDWGPPRQQQQQQQQQHQQQQQQQQQQPAKSQKSRAPRARGKQHQRSAADKAEMNPSKSGQKPAGDKSASPERSGAPSGNPSGKANGQSATESGRGSPAANASDKGSSSQASGKEAPRQSSNGGANPNVSAES